MQHCVFADGGAEPSTVVLIIGAVLGSGGVGAALPGLWKYLTNKNATDQKNQTEQKALDQKGLLGEIERAHARITQVEGEHARCLKDYSDLREKFGRMEEAVRRLEGAKTVALIIADDTGTITEVNYGAYLLLGWSVELVGKKVTSLIPPRFRGNHQVAFNAAVTNSTMSNSIIRETFALHHDGDEVPVNITLSSWLSESGGTTKRMFAAEIRRR